MYYPCNPFPELTGMLFGCNFTLCMGDLNKKEWLGTLNLLDQMILKTPQAKPWSIHELRAHLQVSGMIWERD